MSCTTNQKDVASPAKDQSVDGNKQRSSTTSTCLHQEIAPTTKDYHFHNEDVATNKPDGASPSKKRRRTRKDEMQTNLQPNGAADVSKKQTQSSEEQVGASGGISAQRGCVEDEKSASRERPKEAERVLVTKDQLMNQGSMCQSLQEKDNSNGEPVAVSEEKHEVSTTDGVSKSEEAEPSLAPPVHSQAVHISGVDMVFPENEVPIELCPFSSDGSIDLTHVKSPLRNSMEDASSQVSTIASPIRALAVQEAPTDTAPTTPASVTAEDSATPVVVKRTMGRRKRRKKLIYSSTRSKTATKAKREQASVLESHALEDKLSISVNRQENGVEVENESDAPSSPVYPDADASHLYPSTSEGAPWQWDDVDPYFDPLTQSDLDNLVRWRRENANFIASNPKAWRDVAEMESKRALLETIVADASDVSAAYMEFPIRRGRRYLDVWEESNYLDQQKRNGSMGENPVKTQEERMKKKRKGTVRAETSLLVSHRDLVYGYDDDLFQEFSDHLTSRVKACQSKSVPATPPTPLVRRQQSTNAKLEEGAAQTVAEKAEFDEEVLPSFPTRQLHPASLGLWKLRKNQIPDYLVVHPASVNRSQIPTRWKEEMKHHHQQQYELQLQQIDELADPSDGDDEGAGDGTRGRPRVTISNCQVTGGLPSFGNSLEEDEISRTLAASIRSLVPLSIYNWRTAQLVYERAACSIQCAPILEGEAAAAQELEDVFLQLCPPKDTSADTTVRFGSGLTRQPRSSQTKNASHDMIAYSVRHDVADNCSLAVVASVEFALKLSVGDVVDVLDQNGCWNYGEVLETYSEDTLRVAKFLLMRFSLWSEDTVEWIAASEGRILPQGVADGSRPCSVGPTRAHRVRVRYDQNLARELERSFPRRQAKQTTATSRIVTHRQHDNVERASNDLQKAAQKRRRKHPAT